jgi:lipopolysaccharide export system permease protein
MQQVIDRYLLREIAVPFVMVVSVLTFVLLMGKILQVMDLLINRGARFADIALLMGYLLPSFLIFTLPIALLIAILIGIGRLSGDNEITILKMSGVSLLRLSVPVAGAAVAVFLVTAVTNLLLVPYGNVASRNHLYEMARQKASIGIREKVFIDDFRGLLLYADQIPVKGDFLEGVLISDNRISREPSTILARRARLISDPDTRALILRLEEGSTHTIDAGLKNYRRADFRQYDLRLDLASTLSESAQRQEKRGADMTLVELLAALRSSTLRDAAIREMALELHKKLAIPFSCFVFALLGLPLSIRAHRSVRARGFTIGLAIVLLYYLLSLIGEALVETGRLAPVIGAWGPNVVFGLAGLALFALAAGETTPRRVVGHHLRRSGPDPSPGAGGAYEDP